MYCVSLRLPSRCASAIAREFRPEDIDKANKAFNNLGPTARLCISFVEDPDQLPFYQSCRQTALFNLSIIDLIKGLQQERGLGLDASPFLFLIRREELNPRDTGYLQRYTVEPITSHVRRLLESRLIRAMQDERSHVYKLFETVQGSKQIANFTFRSMVQFKLQSDVALTLVPMVKHPSTSGAEPRWRSQFVDKSEPMTTEDSGSVGAIAANRPLSVRFKPNEVFKCRPSELSSVQSGAFYLPGSHQPAFDSFILYKGVLYMFQITIATGHTFDGGVMEFFPQKLLQTISQETEWYFIFVIPPGGGMEFLEPSDERLKEFWKKVKLFTAECDPTERRNPWLEE